MAGRIPDHFIDDLLARIDIVDLIESHLPLRKAGRDFQALCPFHGEKTPSFTISREKQFYHCFGCGVHGTAIGFLMNYRNLEFREAVEELAQIAGLEIPQEARRENVANTRDLFVVLEHARKHYEDQLRHADDRGRAVDYLKGRGITGKVAKQFQLGFAPDGWRNLFDALIASGSTESQLERAGLAIRRDHGGHYDRFRDRIMFPIHDRRGRVLGFGGRILDQGEPKYLNSPETEVFHKGRELYGLHEALAAGQLDNLIVVEGYMDVIALNQFGLTNAVATLGTAVTSDHLDQLFRHTPAITFCFDGDAAGKRAAWKALEISLSRLEGNREVRFSFLPDGHDPDTAVREFGADGFIGAARNFSLSDYLLDSLKAEIDTATSEGRTRLVASAKPYLRQIPDDTHRAIGAKLLAEETRFDEDLIRRELGFTASRARARVNSGPLDRYTSRTLLEQTLALLLQRPDLARCLDHGCADFLRAELEGCATLLAVWEIARGGVASTATLLERFRGDVQEATLLELSALDLNISDSALETEMTGAIARLRTRAEGQRFAHIKAIPFNQWSAEQKAIVRDYKRGH
jgi:DNA primase